MKPNWFHLSNINWPRYWIVLSTVLAFWTAVGTLVPPDHYKVINTVLGAFVTTLSYFIRASKYVKDRGTVPQRGEEP